MFPLSIVLYVHACCIIVTVLCNVESRQIYKGIENQIKVYILMTENHYDVISNIAGFTCVNQDHT